MSSVIFDHFQAFCPPLKADYDDTISWKQAVRRWMSIPSEVREARVKITDLEIVADQFLYEDLNDIDAIPAEPFFDAKIREAELVGIVTAKDLTTAWLTCLGQIKKFDVLSSRNMVMAETEGSPFCYRGTKEYFDDFLGRVFYVCEMNGRGLCWFNIFSIYSKDYGRMEISLNLFSKEVPAVVGRRSGMFSIVPQLLEDNRSPDELWERSQCDEDVKEAICCAVRKVWNGTGDKLPPTLFVARGFYSTLRDIRGTNDGQFSSACMQKVVQAATLSSLLDVSDFRVNKRAASKARKHGRFTAKRAHVTKGNEGLRLMFWQSETEIVLDSIRTKWDVQIDDPTTFV